MNNRHSIMFGQNEMKNLSKMSDEGILALFAEGKISAIKISPDQMTNFIYRTSPNVFTLEISNNSIVSYKRGNHDQVELNRSVKLNFDIRDFISNTSSMYTPPVLKTVEIETKFSIGSFINNLLFKKKPKPSVNFNEEDDKNDEKKKRGPTPFGEDL